MAASDQIFRPKPPSLKIMAEISQGAHGSVHFGELDGRPVAVKRIHRALLEAPRGQGDCEQVMTDFKRECQLLEQVHHPHVVHFRGAFYDETTNEPLLVMERMRENLRDFLVRNRNDLSRKRQLEICIGVVRGLRFLHNYKPPIVHRDLTDTNVMFDKNGLVKIGDLGRSKLKNADYCTRALPGTYSFMPPEAMPDQSCYNEKLDIFSLGVLMLEVATQQPPRVELEYIGMVKEIFRRREDLFKLEDSHPLKPLILSCLEDDPKERPDIVTVHTQLQAIVKEVQDLRSIKVPNMPMGAISYVATVHNSKVYIRASSVDERGARIAPILVYSTREYKWSILPQQRSSAAIAVVNNHVTLIGGQDILTYWYTNTPSTWYEEEVRWKQVLPPMPTGRSRPAVIFHDNLLLVTGGLAEDGFTVLNTTDVLNLTTMKWTFPERLNLPVPLWQHHLVLCGEYLYLVGGATMCRVQSPAHANSWAWRAKWSDVKQTAAPQLSQPQRGIWTRIADPPTLFPTAVSCGGALYTVGGITRDDKPVSIVHSYIPARNQWVSVGNMSVGRYFHCAVPLNSNTIFVAGGQVIHNGEAFFSPLAELLVL